MATAQGRIATWYVVTYVVRICSLSKKRDRRLSSRTFSTVIPARVGIQVSSSVSTETTSNTSPFEHSASDEVTVLYLCRYPISKPQRAASGVRPAGPYPTHPATPRPWRGHLLPPRRAASSSA